MEHGSAVLHPWEGFTTGRPAALGLPPEAAEIEQRLAQLVGCKGALLASSTLHLFWDLFGALASGNDAIYLDQGAYPVASWGAERASLRGTAVRSFPHRDVDALRALLRRTLRRGARPVVVADGYCVGCGRIAPIAALAGCVEEYGGYLVLDDTQGLGILGAGICSHAPYGVGGGGALRAAGVESDRVVVASSLAKGLGVPLAVLAAGAAVVRRFAERSETRVHCSPPSIPTLRAVARALAINALHGDALRYRLAGLVYRFQSGLEGFLLRPPGNLFPVQTLSPGNGVAAEVLHGRLLQLGVRTVLHRGREGKGARISFLIRADHCPSDIDSALEVLGRVLSPRRTKSQRGKKSCMV